MWDIFKKHIAKFAKFADDDFEEIKKFFDTKEVAKKENLVVEGQLLQASLLCFARLITKVLHK